MAGSVPSSPVKEAMTAPPGEARAFWKPMESLRHEVERLFDDFDRGFSRNPFRSSLFDTEPFWRRDFSWAQSPAVDIADRKNAYEITAELPGLTERDIEVKLVDGTLTIKGEKQTEKEEEKENYVLSERHYGSFERRFGVPEGVDASKIEAAFKNGVLTLTLPKTPEAQKSGKTIPVKAI